MRKTFIARRTSMMHNRRGATLLDILIILVLLSFAVAIALPMLAHARITSRRVSCASNMSAIGKAMILYADQGGNGDTYPTTSTSKDPMDPNADAQQALTLFYRSFINDLRVFCCPANGIPQNVLASVLPTGNPDWRAKSFKQSKPGIDGRSTSYRYSPGHRQEDGQCIVLADRQGTGPKGNSDNHGRDVGQNCLAASGNV